MSSFRTERKARGTLARIANRETPRVPTDARQPGELAVLSVKSQTARYRFLESDRTVTLRSRRFWVPGEIVRVKPRKEWVRSG